MVQPYHGREYAAAEAARQQERMLDLAYLVCTEQVRGLRLVYVLHTIQHHRWLRDFHARVASRTGYQ